jgi:tetratricopeptide (TPR) repeat protein
MVVGSVALSASCAPRTSRVEAQMETLKEEHAPDKLMARGRAFASIGDYTRAEQYISAAMQAGADEAVALPILLRVCVQQQRYRAALSHAQPRLEKRPEDFRLRFVVGSLYATIGDRTMAWEHLMQVSQEQPDFAEVHFALGMLWLSGESDPVSADEHFREYLRLEPEGEHASEARSHLLRATP